MEHPVDLSQSATSFVKDVLASRTFDTFLRQINGVADTFHSKRATRLYFEWLLHSVDTIDYKRGSPPSTCQKGLGSQPLKPSSDCRL